MRPLITQHKLWGVLGCCLRASAKALWVRVVCQIWRLEISTMTDGRLAGQEIPCSPTCQVFNDLPRLWFFGVRKRCRNTICYAAASGVGGR
jgi:hypothetical protein